MLARLALAPEALDEAVPGIPVAAAKSLHTTLLEALNAHGSLVFASNAEALDFVNAVKAGQGLPPGAAQKWRETLIHLRKLGRINVLVPPRDTGLSSVRVLADLRKGWGGHVEVAVVGNKASSCIGVPTDVGLLEDSEARLEVATMVTAPHSRTISQYRELARTAWMSAGESRDTFWNDVLEPVAAQSRAVTVLDGYLFHRLWRKAEQQPYSRRWDQEHVAWLLELLDRIMAPGSEVELVGGFDPRRPASAEDTAALICAEWSPAAQGRLRSVTLVLAPKDRHFPHDRHIRFNTGVAVLINAGLDRLRERTIWDPNGMGWHYRWAPAGVEELRRAEQRTRTMASAQSHTVFHR
jgi:hypothetical protein